MMAPAGGTWRKRGRELVEGKGRERTGTDFVDGHAEEYQGHDHEGDWDGSPEDVAGDHQEKGVGVWGLEGAGKRRTR